MKTDNIHFWTHLAQFFLDRKILQTNVVEKLEAHVLCSVTFLRKSCRLWDNVIKYCRARQDTDDNMAHAHCMLDTEGYKHTHTEVVQYPLLFHCHSGYTNVPQCHAILALPVLLTPLRVLLWRSAAHKRWSILSSDLDWSQAVPSFIISYFGHRFDNSLAVRCLSGQDLCEVWGVFIAV